MLQPLRTILNVDPLWGFPGETAEARIRSADLQPWPKRMNEFRWRIRGQIHNEDQWLGETTLLKPIVFPIANYLGVMKVEAYEVCGDGALFPLAQSQLIVLESREQMLEMAIREPDESCGLAIFDELASQQWPSDYQRRGELGNWLNSYCQNDKMFDRAFKYQLVLCRGVFEKIAGRLAKGYGEECSEELMSRFVAKAWEHRRKFDPERGIFHSWATLLLCDCWHKFLRESSKHNRLRVIGGRSEASIDSGLARLENREYYSKVVTALERRFSIDKVSVFITWLTETPRPTYLEIADRFNLHLGCSPKTRESSVSRIIKTIESYLKSSLREGGLL